MSSKTEEKRNEFVERVVKSLEAGVVPWRREELPAQPQQNAISGKSYGGLNALYLMEAAGAKGYSDPRWLTHKDAEKQGLKPRGGEKGVHLEYWDKGEDGKPTVRNYPVFNVQQLTGPLPNGVGDIPAHYEKAGEILEKAGIELPPGSGEKERQDALKSILTSTAEKSAAMSEAHTPSLQTLRVSMASAFLTQEAGIPLDLDHGASSRDWAQSLRRNPRELFRATRDAVKLTGEVLGKEWGQEREVPNAKGLPTPKELPDPQIGQRVTFQPHEGKAKLTGNVVGVDENAVTLQCGRMTISATRGKGAFVEAPEPDRTQTKEYAQEEAQKHVGESGKVYFARGEDATYKGTIVEITPSFAIQKIADETAILHRLKDLETSANEFLIQEGRDVSIAKGTKGSVTVAPWNREQDKQAREQRKEREGVAL
jgi:antirestriction protein ArdC